MMTMFKKSNKDYEKFVFFLSIGITASKENLLVWISVSPCNCYSYNTYYIDYGFIVNHILY